MIRLMALPIDFLNWLASAASDYKLMLEHGTNIHSDAFHVLFGVAIQFVGALILRRTLADWLPLALVVGLEIANEVSEFMVEVWATPAIQLGESAKDFALTLSVPILLFLVARYRPSIIRRAPGKRPAQSWDDLSE